MRWIDELHPHLLTLQEVDRTGGVCQAGWIGERVGMTACFAPSFTAGRRQFGNAVLSAFP